MTRRLKHGKRKRNKVKMKTVLVLSCAAMIPGCFDFGTGEDSTGEKIKEKIEESRGRTSSNPIKIPELARSAVSLLAR